MLVITIKTDRDHWIQIGTIKITAKQRGKHVRLYISDEQLTRVERDVEPPKRIHHETTKQD